MPLPIAKIKIVAGDLEMLLSTLENMRVDAE